MQSHAAVQCDGALLRMTAAQLREHSVDLAAAGYSHVTLLAVLPTGARSAFDLPASWALAWCGSVSLVLCRARSYPEAAVTGASLQRGERRVPHVVRCGPGETAAAHCHVAGGTAEAAPLRDQGLQRALTAQGRYIQVHSLRLPESRLVGVRLLLKATCCSSRCSLQSGNVHAMPLVG